MNGTSRAVRPAFAVRKTVWPSRIPRSARWPATYRKPASGLSTALGGRVPVGADRGDDCRGQQIADDVDGEDELDARPGEQERAERWCGEPDRAAGKGVQGVGGGEFVAGANDGGKQSAGGRAEHRRRRTLDQDRQVDRPDPIRVGEQDQRDRGRADEIGDPHRAGQIAAVQEDAGPRSDEQGRQRLEGEGEAGRDGGAGQVEHVERDRDDQQPGADPGDPATDPQLAEVAVPKCSHGPGSYLDEIDLGKSVL